jgi:hypothetical protein
VAQTTRKFTKQERARLRQLAEEAWEAELEIELKTLFEDFGRWVRKGMTAFDLSEKIHEFHNGISRELYGRYTTLNPIITVSRAVALNILGEEKLGAALHEKLSEEIETFANGNFPRKR